MMPRARIRSHLWFLGVLALLVGPGPALGETYVDDPLTAAPQGAAQGVSTGRQGGTFGPDGWTVDGAENTIWYRIPAALPQGRLEVSVTGLSTETNLTGELHDLVVMYGTTDRAEPVPYAPFFRSNDYKVQIRIIGTGEPSRGPGASKMEVRRCPMGEPGYHELCDPACTETVESSYLNGAPRAPLPWNPNRTYRVVVEWAPGWMTYARDEAMVRAEYDGTFAPQDLVVRLGSPRHTAGTPNRLPVGMTFRDLLVVGEPGQETADCTAVDQPPEPQPEPGGQQAEAPHETGACVRGVGLDPRDGRGTEAVLRATYAHCDGADAFRIVQIWVGDEVTPDAPRVSAGLEYGIISAFGQTCMPGESTMLTNDWGGIDCQETRVAQSGNEMTVHWALFFDAEVFGGQHQVFYDAKGGEGDPEPRLGWTPMGTFTVAEADGENPPDGEGETALGGDEDLGTPPASQPDPEPSDAAMDEMGDHEAAGRDGGGTPDDQGTSGAGMAPESPRAPFGEASAGSDGISQLEGGAQTMDPLTASPACNCRHGGGAATGAFATLVLLGMLRGRRRRR